MLIVPALSQWIGLPASSGQSIGWSEIFPLHGADYAAAVMTVEQIYGGMNPGDCTVAFETWTSLDGRSWVFGGPTASTFDVTDPTHPPAASNAPVHGAFVRFRFRLDVSMVSGTAGALSTLRVVLSKKGA